LKNFALLLILLWIGITGCNPFIGKPEQDNSGKSSIRFDDNGDTVLINYNEKGILLSEVTVKNGRMNGVAFNYYENGKIQNEINYKDGIKEGRVTWNYENGKLYRETQYVNGEIEGIQKKYYEDGKLMAEIPYAKGELQPGTKEYTSDGKLKKIIPDVIFEAIDKTAFDDKYILRITLSKKQKKTKFTRLVEFTKGNPIPVRLDVKDNFAEIVWNIPKGSFIMEKVRLEVEFNTSMGNPVKIETAYNVAAENR